MRIFTLFRLELMKMYRQRGTYAGPIALVVFIGLMVWGMWEMGGPFGDAQSQFGDDFAVGGGGVTGPMIPYLLLEMPVAVNVFIPLLISMVAGGLIAGEAQRGTLRTVLTRPVRRWAVVTAKIAASFVHALMLVTVLGGVSLLLGLLVFGPGDLVVPHGGFRLFDQSEALVRLGVAYALVAATMFSVAAIAVFCSTIFEHPLTASGVTITFLIVSGVLMLIPYFDWLAPYLLTKHFDSFHHVFEKHIAWDKIQVDLTYVGAYTAAALAGTLAVFCRKDVTC